MKINFSEPQRTGIIFTIDKDKYLLNYGELSLAHCLVSFVEQAMVLEEDFYIIDGGQNISIEATDHNILVTKNNITKEYQLTKADLAKAIARDIRKHSLQHCALNAAYKRKRLSKEEYQKYINHFKREERVFLKDLDWLDDVINDEPTYHTKEDVKKYKQEVISVITSNRKHFE